MRAAARQLRCCTACDFVAAAWQRGAVQAALRQPFSGGTLPPSHGARSRERGAGIEAWGKRRAQRGRQAGGLLRAVLGGAASFPAARYTLRRGSAFQSSGLVGDGLLAGCGSGFAASAKLMCLRVAEHEQGDSASCWPIKLSVPRAAASTRAQRPRAAQQPDGPPSAAAADTGRRAGALVGGKLLLAETPEHGVKRPPRAHKTPGASRTRTVGRV